MESIESIEIADAQGLENIIILLKKNFILSVILGYISYIIYNKIYTQNKSEDYEIFNNSDASKYINKKSRRSVTPTNIDIDDEDDNLLD